MHTNACAGAGALIDKNAKNAKKTDAALIVDAWPLDGMYQFDCPLIFFDALVISFGWFSNAGEIAIVREIGQLDVSTNWLGGCASGKIGRRLLGVRPFLHLPVMPNRGIARMTVTWLQASPRRGACPIPP
jgi:hypothetical protein